MAVPVIRKVILDTNVYIDYLRASAYPDWVVGRVGQTVSFLSGVVLMELRLGANSPRRKRVIDRIQAAFPKERILIPSASLFGRAGQVFRRLHGDGSGLGDRLGPMDDILIALTAWQIGATVVTSNLAEFRRIQAHLPGLSVIPPIHGLIS